MAVYPELVARRSVLFSGIALLALTHVGCGGSSTNDGGPDSTLEDSPLCTIPGCAAAPCTPGCVFSPLVGGSCGDPNAATVQGKTVEACDGFCGFFQEARALGFSGGVGCARYHPERPGCGPCGVGAWSSDCFELGPVVDYERGGTICVYPLACNPPIWDDLAPYCPPPDMSVPVDGATID
jgi:hypothetical protein